ncbi:NDP-sugar pyrophosphorylase family protein [Haloferula luteola]|uniref:NDP-sugar pyrophosphorylase family protein n=1 Tax=Haloferula luteola TaxID=595692 RepID=A0A840V3Z6_9BACT|nr:sugar phosphate nucleotidyltransferase [Haloferula luteola]MBB5350374.1 NDP-sugar pyrophosphorylase family protein [Haloferula luteola]
MIRKAFLLGAGLGTRLQPLTHGLPKPLVPLFHKPMVGWAAERCMAAGIEAFAVNTHHLPEKWQDPEWGVPCRGGWKPSELRGGNGLFSMVGDWAGRSTHLFSEPDLLETGGGIRNIADWVGGDDVLVHNGDIFSTMPLERLIEAHEQSGNGVTLALRSEGAGRHIAFEDGQVVDIRNRIGRGHGTHHFSGVYCFSPELLGQIPEGKVSVIPAFLELAKRGRIGGVLLDEGDWFDLGDEASYLAAHRELALSDAIHETATISPHAVVERSVIGPRAVVEAGAVVVDSVVWQGAVVSSGQRVESQVVMR